MSEKTKEAKYKVHYRVSSRQGGEFSVSVDCTKEQLEKEFEKFKDLENKPHPPLP